MSVKCPFVRLYLTVFFNFVDNKLCPALRSSHLTFSKDQDSLSIPLVCHGSLPLFIRSYWECVGFEYFANPQSRSDGFITWQMDGQPTIKMGAGAVGPDQGSNGSGVGARLIPEEPMVRSSPIHLTSAHRLCLVNSHQPGHVTYVIYSCRLIWPL